MAANRTTKKRPARSLGRKQIITPEEKSRWQGFRDLFRFGESYSSLILGIIVVIAAAALLVSFTKNRTGTTQPSQQDISATRTVARTTEIPSPTVIATPTSVVTPTTAATPTSAPTVRPTVKPTTKPTGVPTKAVKPTAVPTKAQPTPQGGSIYTVKTGDNLWKIAVATYTNGYAWTQIAKTNHLSNPGALNVGQKLQLPSKQLIAQIVPTVAPQMKPTVTVAPTVIEQKQAPSSSMTIMNGAPRGPTGAKITGTRYTVQHGDDLWDIAVRAYGNGYKWVDIARANNLTNPSIIHSGNIFKLPR